MFELQISDIQSAPTIAWTWANKTISLVNSNVLFPHDFGNGHEIFAFDDLSSEKEESHRPGMSHAPKMNDIKGVLEFTNAFTDEDKVLIHCHAGLGRSPSVAVLALIQHGETIDDAVKKVVDLRPSACFNKLMFRLGDVALGLNNELIDYMDVWFSEYTYGL
jgi:predicted protein tyrosine phosphatase